MKFRYYITDTFEGKIVGTNRSAVAKDFAACSDYFVVDTETGEWLQSTICTEAVKDVEENHDN